MRTPSAADERVGYDLAASRHREDYQRNGATIPPADGAQLSAIDIARRLWGRVTVPFTDISNPVIPNSCQVSIE